MAFSFKTFLGVSGSVVGGIVGGPAGASIGGSLGGLAGGLADKHRDKKQRERQEAKMRDGSNKAAYNGPTPGAQIGARTASGSIYGGAPSPSSPSYAGPTRTDRADAEPVRAAANTARPDLLAELVKGL